jgi:radical SAM superfamily enzyme YgiQ (UPF0313 family)
MIDAVFIYPKFGFPVLAEPVGICFILPYLKEKGFNVKIDEGFLRGDRLDEVVSRILRRDPLLVGITANSRPEFKSAKEFAKELRGKGYIGRIIIGGHAISLNARSFLQECRFVDAVAIGEGEITSEKILKKIKEGKNWKMVRGLIYINDNGEFVDTGIPK